MVRRTVRPGTPDVNVQKIALIGISSEGGVRYKDSVGSAKASGRLQPTSMWLGSHYSFWSTADAGQIRSAGTEMEAPSCFFLPGAAGNLFAMYYAPAET